MENIFEKTHLFIEPIEKGSQNHVVKFKFTDPSMKSKIDKVEASCGCSGAILLDDGVLVSFNELEVINWNQDTINQNRVINPEGYPILKEVNVYLNDGLELDIKREDGGSYKNTRKDRIILSFGSYVKF